MISFIYLQKELMFGTEIEVFTKWTMIVLSHNVINAMIKKQWIWLNTV